MTERIDLDELDGSTEAEDDGNRGDWFWRDDGATPATPDDPDAAATPDADADEGADPTEPADSTADAASPIDDEVVPGVPQTNGGAPAGVPVEGGGAGSGTTTRRDDGAEETEETEETDDPGAPDDAAEASGPHGGGVDDMTMALTYGAVGELANTDVVVADARRWADWVGLVGDVDAHVINKFQRDRGIDVDFFNGTGTGPGERLADVDEHSMFFAERMVVVGIEGRDEWIAERAGWEFVPLAEAAAEADWDLASE